VRGDQAAEQLAEYLAKGVKVVDRRELAAMVREERAVGLGLELTHALPGRAREDLRTRPVWALLDELAETGEASALARWHEWESASKGRRQVGWSMGLRERFAPTIEELTDQQVVDQVVGDEDDDVIAWTADQWRAFIARPARAADLLEAAQHGGVAGALALLESWGDVACSIVTRDRGGPAPPASAHRAGRTGPAARAPVPIA
jgi:hypothetical protein